MAVVATCLTMALSAVPGAAWALSAACTAINSGSPYSGTYTTDASGNGTSTSNGPFDSGEEIHYAWSANSSGGYLHFVDTVAGGMLPSANAVKDQTAASGSGTYFLSNHIPGDTFTASFTSAPYGDPADIAKANASVSITLSCSGPTPTPDVTAISPTSGPAAGGTNVSVTGTDFTGATDVRFAGASAASFTVNSATSITATSPAGTGTAHVQVVSAGGISATSSADVFTYIAAPAVTAVSPTAGPLGGGTSVSLTGTGFTGATAVNFGVTAATSFTINSATSITAIAPAGSAGTVNIRVTAPTGTSATASANQFTYAAAPTITAVSPTSGAAAGGTSVTVTGTGFSSASAVAFGATAAASFTINSATSITATAPAGTGTVDIRVTTPGGVSATSAADQFTYVAAPTVTAVSPTSGPASGGTTVTVTGTGFSGATAVAFGGTAAASFTVNSATSITATSPAGTGTVDIRVTTVGGASATSSADQFTYIAAPTVTAASPAVGPLSGGTSVTLTGTGFSGATAVAFGGTAAASFTVNSATSVTATSPAGTGTVNIRVTTPAGTSATASANQFTYANAPTVTAISPTSGPASGGTSITLTGTSFSGATAVAFGGTAAASFTINSATSITATAPAGTGVVDIAVTTPSGVSATSAADQFTYVAGPAVTSISPSSGSPSGGTSVTLTGTGFSGATAVAFGGTAAASFTVNSATSITATAPAGTGVVDILVTTPAGTSATSSADRFTYSATPVVTSLSPSGGLSTGGTIVTITGTGFGASLSDVSSVTFGGAAASNVVWSGPTSLSVTAPAGSGTVDVRVTIGGVSSAPAASGRFTYAAAPSITAISPPEGAADGGQRITITGTGFRGASEVKFGDQSAASFNVVSDTSIEATSPPGSGAVAISVTTPGGRATAQGVFAYGQRPVIQTLGALGFGASGPATGGTQLAITGANFTGATAVTIADRPAQRFTIVSDTTIFAWTPAAPAGQTHVRVTTRYGVSLETNESTFTYTDGLTELDIIVPRPEVKVVSGQAVSVAIATVSGGVGTPTLSIRQASGIPLPGWLRASVDGGTATISGTPPAGFLGKLTLVIVARDAGGSQIQKSFALTVADKASAGDPPVAGDIAFKLGAGGTTSVSLSRYVTGAFTSLKIATAPAQGTASLAGFVLNYAADNNTYGSEDVFSYTAIGPGGESTGRVVVGRTSTPPPAPPPQVQVVTQPPAPGAPTAPVDIPLSPIGGGGVGSLVGPLVDVDVVSPPAYGVVVVTYPPKRLVGVAEGAPDRDVAAGVGAARAQAGPAQAQADAEEVTVSYTPNAGFIGTDSFTLVGILDDNGRTAPLTVSIKVAGPPATAQNLTAKTQAGRPVTVALTGGANGPFTAAAVTSISPTNAGKATIAETTTAGVKGFNLTFTPEGAFTGKATVSYTLSNQYGPSTPATVTVTVDARADPASDPEVNALANGQADLTRRFAAAQIGNFARRNEALHGGGEGGMQISLAPGVFDRGKGDLDRYFTGRTGAASPDRADPVERLLHRLTPEQEINALAQGADDAKTTAKAGPREAGGIEGWASGSVTVGRRGAKDGAAKFDLSSSGLSAGADLKLSPGLSLGIGGGAGRDVAEVGSQASRIDGRNSVFAVYGSAQPTEGLFLDAVAGAGALDYRLRRFVTATGAIAEAQRDGDMTFASLTGAMDRSSRDLRWSAYGRLEYVNAELDGYVEAGAGQDNLAFDPRSLESLSGVLGGRLSIDRELGKGRILTPRLRLELRHEFQDADGETIRYADWLTGPNYLTSGRGWARDRLSLGGGLTLREAGSWKLDIEAGAEIAADELYGTLRAEGSVSF